METEQRLKNAGTDDGDYRLLVESITDYAIYMLDRTGHVVSWNPGAQRFKGYSADEIIGLHFSRFYRQEDRDDGLPERALRIAAAEGSLEAEGWRIRKNGEAFWAHVVIDPVRNADGELIGFAKITRDLTERAEAEATLKRSEEQFRLLVQSVTDYAIYMLDRDGLVTSWNPGAMRIKGYAPAEIIGEHFSRFYTDEDRAKGEPARALETAVREGRFAKEGWRQRKDGTRFWASVVIDPIRDGGQLIGFAKITRDLTEREAAQRELEKAREALFQSQKMDAIGQLTGGVAHDFNNLLMATLSSLELLRKRLPNDVQAHRLLDNAVEGARRGATLTQRMLAFARRQDLNLVRVEIPSLVQGMSELFKRALGPAIRIDIRFPPQLEPVIADVNQLEMALLNLVVNARDAIGEGGHILIEADHELVGLGASSGLAPGRYVKLNVTDDGAGMDAETLERAKEPFFTTKGVGKGTGLGLSMVHGLAEQSGGRFDLSSMAGQGTTATLWLPVAAEEAPAALASPDDPAMPVDGRALVVLAVDDDSLVLMNTVALLEDLGHQVFEAWSGEEALAIFEREPDIDLLITDQAMPNMTGVELASRVLELRPRLPVILATGYGELPAGMSPSIRKLSKPFGQAALTRMLSDIFYQHEVII